MILAFSICSSTWSHESLVQRKKPSFVRSRYWLGFERDILETLSSRRPRWVNPNSSKGMIGRSSERTSDDRISARVREVRERNMRRRGREEGMVVVV